MRTKVWVGVAVLTVVLAAGLAAQQNDPPKQLTVEQLYLRNVEVQVMRERAYSYDYDSKVSVLDSLEQQLSAPSSQPTPDQEQIMEYLSLEGTGHRVRQEGRIINDFPDIRRRATALLAKVNDDESAQDLVTVLLSDNEPMVRAEAAYALGRMSLPDNTRIVQGLALAVSRSDPQRADNNWAYAVLTAFEQQSKQPGGIRDQSAWQAIMAIASSGYSRTVRDKASQILISLRG